MREFLRTNSFGSTRMLNNLNKKKISLSFSVSDRGLSQIGLVELTLVKSYKLRLNSASAKLKRSFDLVGFRSLIPATF